MMVGKRKGESMVVGKRYVVTRASDDGTFVVGDHLTLHVDGTIGCYEAEGWIEQSDVEQAMKGVVVEIDKKWLANRKAMLTEELAALEA